jgi:hypothetical protein
VQAEANQVSHAEHEDDDEQVAQRIGQDATCENRGAGMTRDRNRSMSPLWRSSAMPTAVFWAPNITVFAAFGKFKRRQTVLDAAHRCPMQRDTAGTLAYKP